MDCDTDLVLFCSQKNCLTKAQRINETSCSNNSKQPVKTSQHVARYQPTGWGPTADWKLHSKGKSSKNTHLFLLTGISWNAHMPYQTEKIQQRSQKMVWINNLISESAQALLLTLNVLATSQSCRWFPPPFCTPLSFSTFGWRLGCEHSLLLGFRGRIHSGGGLVVVGWGIVHVRSSSTDVHPCKWCRRVKICQEVSPERMRIHLTCDPQDTNVA